MDTYTLIEYKKAYGSQGDLLRRPPGPMYHYEYTTNAPTDLCACLRAKRRFYPGIDSGGFYEAIRENNLNALSAYEHCDWCHGTGKTAPIPWSELQ